MPALDAERFAELRRDFSGVDLADLLATFTAVTTTTVAEVDAGAGAADASAVQAAAHKLRGGCLAIGALELARLGGSLEERARTGRLDEEALRLVDAVGREWLRLRREVDAAGG